jgi:hypothetical protein
LEFPKFRFGIRSLRAKRSNLAFCNEIAAHLSDARNDRPRKGFSFLNRDLRRNMMDTQSSCFVKALDLTHSMASTPCPLGQGGKV